MLCNISFWVYPLLDALGLWALGKYFLLLLIKVFNFYFLIYLLKNLLMALFFLSFIFFFFNSVFLIWTPFILMAVHLILSQKVSEIFLTVFLSSPFCFIYFHDSTFHLICPFCYLSDSTPGSECTVFYVFLNFTILYQSGRKS